MAKYVYYSQNYDDKQILTEICWKCVTCRTCTFQRSSFKLIKWVLAVENLTDLMSRHFLTYVTFKLGILVMVLLCMH